MLQPVTFASRKKRDIALCPPIGNEGGRGENTPNA